MILWTIRGWELVVLFDNKKKIKSIGFFLENNIRKSESIYYNKISIPFFEISDRKSKAMMKAQNILVEPPLYFASEHIFDLAFHPKASLLACCMINGQVEM